MTFCEVRKKQNKHLKAVRCCGKCHKAHDAVRAAEADQPEVDWVCCEMYHIENLYRPTTRKINELTS